MTDVAVTSTVESGKPATRRDVPATIGRYRVEQALGAGGMGIVHAAFDPDLERRVAIKVLHRASDPDSRARLLREARAMAKLAHSNVVSVYEVGTAGDDFVVMELFDGGSLESWLRERDRTPREILHAFVAAGRGLAAAHAAGLVHRDFKPHNVLRAKDGRVAVSDFGLAREMGPQTSDLAPQVPDLAEVRGPRSEVRTATGAILGTPAYMAPEQWRGAESTPATDQFAFCVALWEALAGTRPFPGSTSEELQAAVEQGPSASDTKKIPRRLRATLRRGLDPDPAKRWPSMDALLAHLTRRAFVVPSAAVAVIAAAAIAFFALHGGSHTGQVVTLSRADFDELVECLDTKTGAGYFFDKWPGARIAFISDAPLMKAGLRDDDRLLRVAGRAFGSAALSDLAYANRVDIAIRRGDDSLELAVVSDPPEVSDPVFDTIVKIDDTHVRIPRAVIDAVAAHPRWLERGAGDLGHYVLVRPYSLYAHLGLLTKDRLVTIDGVPVSAKQQLDTAIRSLPWHSPAVVVVERTAFGEARRIPLTLEVAP